MADYRDVYANWSMQLYSSEEILEPTSPSNSSNSHNIPEQINAKSNEINERPSSAKRIAGGFFRSTVCKLITAALIISALAAAFAVTLTVFLTNHKTETITTTTSAVTLTTITTSTTTTTTVTTITSSTTSTATTTTVTTTTSSSTSSATTSTTTTTTTTTMVCAATCVNQTISTASRIAFYSFDSVTTDATGNYPLGGISSLTYVPGWVGSAVTFNAANGQYLSTSNLPLNLHDFTIDFWFYALNVNAGWDIPFMGQFTATSADLCLFLTIFTTRLYFGFFADDSVGNSMLTPNTWYHAAFVFQNSTLQRSIYLNGILDSQVTAFGPLQATSGNFTVGGARIGGRVPTLDAYYTGYIDHVTVSGRAKTACEVYLNANLACYFTFDSASSVVDAGPNFLTATNTGASVTSGRINQALQFSSSLSYITVSGISALASNSSTFSISMWISTTSVSGGATLIHTSTQSNGQSTCLLMWGLTSTGLVTVNVIDSSNNVISATSSSALQLNTWTHIAQTFSTTNGIRLYINSMLVATATASTGRPVGPFAIIGASPSGTTSCSAGLISRGQFYGSVDEFRVFRNELTANDICRLAFPT